MCHQSFIVPAQIGVCPADSVETGSDIWMGGAECLFLNGQSALIQWKGFFVLALSLESDTEVDQVASYVRVRRPKNFFRNGQGPPIVVDRLVEFVELAVYPSNVCEKFGAVAIVRPPSFSLIASPC